MRTAIVDIECSALEAVGAGFLLCAVVKPEGGKPKVFRYDTMHCKPGKEKRLVQAIVDELMQYDMLVMHNGERFDWNYIKSRAMLFGIDIPKRPLSYDTLKAFRRCGFLTRPNGFGKPTASLAFVVDFLGIEQEKTALYPAEHWKTVWERGEERETAINKLVHHCVSDVAMTEAVYRRLFEVDGAALIRRFK